MTLFKKNMDQITEPYEYNFLGNEILMFDYKYFSQNLSYIIAIFYLIPTYK